MDWTVPPQDIDDGAALLGELHAALTRYVIFPSPQAADAATLYAAATHAQAVWEHATRLVIKSPIKRCGKSRLQEVLRELVHNPIPTANISAAALARSIGETDPPTLILDEADAIWGKKDQRSERAEDLRGILNSGHSRGWPYIRWDAAARRRELCPTFAMAIIGGIGDMPDTIEDRAVVFSMRRRATGERKVPWRSRRAVPQLRGLRGRLHGWVATQLDALATAEPDLPVEDRAADTWEPLVAIADVAGGDWPERARKACLVLTGDADQDEADTAGERLLADLKAIYGEASFLYSATIIARLVKVEDGPWSEWRRGPTGRVPINARGLAALLRPYKIHPRNGREDGTGPVQKGYAAEDLTQAWSSYVGYTATNGEYPQAEPVADDVADSSARTATPPGLALFADVAAVADAAETRLNGATPRVAGAPTKCTVCGLPSRQPLVEGRCTHHLTTRTTA